MNTIQIPYSVNEVSPLGALIAHFNSSSKSVQKAFAKLFKEQMARESELALMQKIQKGEDDIRNGKGICQKEEETTDAFIERLCTM